MVADLRDTLPVCGVGVPFKRIGCEETESDRTEIVRRNAAIKDSVA